MRYSTAVDSLGQSDFAHSIQTVLCQRVIESRFRKSSEILKTTIKIILQPSHTHLLRNIGTLCGFSFVQSEINKNITLIE